MYKKNKSIQKKYLVAKNKELVTKLAVKYNWVFHSEDFINYRYSIVDYHGIYRINIYLSTMTVGLLPIGVREYDFWYKNLSFAAIEDMFNNPSRYDKTIKL